MNRTQHCIASVDIEETACVLVPVYQWKIVHARTCNVWACATVCIVSQTFVGKESLSMYCFAAEVVGYVYPDVITAEDGDIEKKARYEAKKY